MRRIPLWGFAFALLFATGTVWPRDAVTRVASAPARTAIRVTMPATRDGGVAHATSTRICQPGGQWFRLRLVLAGLSGDDRLWLRASSGDSYRLGPAQSGRGAFETRSLRGACVDLVPEFRNAAARYTLSGYTFGLVPVALTSPTVVIAGDLCDTTGTMCQLTSDLALSLSPDAAIVLGDNAYESGALSDYTSRYAPAWGRLLAMTRPVPGNHEYLTPNAAGYFDYFNGASATNGVAGPRGKGYYSWDLGDWHFVALNSNFAPGSPEDATQLQWLTSDLAANTKPCSAAYFHYPLLSTGHYAGYDQVKAYWELLYAGRVDLVFNGHDHNYQRYAPMTPTKLASPYYGIRELVVGTGGRGLYPLTTTHPLLEAADGGTFGVLRLHLDATGYRGEFVPVQQGGFTDAFSGTCKRAFAATLPRYAHCALPPAAVSRASPVARMQYLWQQTGPGMSSPVDVTRRGFLR